MSTKKRIAFSILIIFLIGSPLIFSAAISDSIADLINEWNQRIDSWKLSYYISLFSVIAVAFLGTLSGLLQRTSKAWMRNIAIGSAFSVTIITVVGNEIEIKDHKEINKAIIEAERIVSKIQTWKGKAFLKKDDISYQLVIMDEVSQLTSDLHDIQMKISYVPRHSFNLISTAYAAPDWTKFESMVPTKEGTIYIIGTGEGTELDIARDEAKKSIFLQIETYLQNKIEEIIQKGKKSAEEKKVVVDLLKTKSPTIAKSILKNLKIKETHFENGKQDNYRFFILYQVTTKHLEDFINLYSSVFAQ